jgi:hypothetical protein
MFIHSAQIMIVDASGIVLTHGSKLNHGTKQEDVSEKSSMQRAPEDPWFVAVCLGDR